MNMNSKFVIIVMSIVLAISVAFSCFLIFSLKEAKANGGINNDIGGNNNQSNTTTAEGDNGESENPDDSGSNQGSNSSRKEKAPDITVSDLQGNEVKLSDYLGKPVVLNFWATWCGQCEEEMPDFNSVYEQYNGEVVFLMVNATTTGSETAEKAMAYIYQNTDFSLPFFLDIYGDAKEKYGLSALPYTFFIDEEGYILSRGNHKYSKTNLITTIDNILLGN